MRKGSRYLSRSQALFWRARQKDRKESILTLDGNATAHNTGTRNRRRSRSGAFEAVVRGLWSQSSRRFFPAVVLTPARCCGLHPIPQKFISTCGAASRRPGRSEAGSLASSQRCVHRSNHPGYWDAPPGAIVVDGNSAHGGLVGLPGSFRCAPLLWVFFKGGLE